MIATLAMVAALATVDPPVGNPPETAEPAPRAASAASGDATDAAPPPPIARPPVTSLDRFIERLSGPLVDATDPEVIAMLVQEAGHPAILSEDSLGDPMIESARGDVVWQLYFYDCISGGNCQSVQFYAGFDLAEGLPPQRVNDWHVERRYATVVLDAEGDPRLRYDVYIGAGMRAEAFIGAVETWDRVLVEFLDFIDWE